MLPFSNPVRLLTGFLVGEITYESIVTKREEPLPIAASVIGAPGMYLFFFFFNVITRN
jgi:hypothetical protein